MGHLIGPGDAIDSSNPLDVSQALKLIDVTLVSDVAILATGDVITDTATIAGAVREAGGTGQLRSIIVIDEDDQGQAFDIVFFGATQSLGAKNGVPNITDAAARDILGHIAVLTTDFSDLGGVRIATKIVADTLVLKAATGAKDLFCSLICRSGTPTYTASGLKLRLGFQV
jgi:hypothetical protein